MVLSKSKNKDLIPVSLSVWNGISKMDDRYIKRRFHNEMLKAYRIYSIAPESFFKGYLYLRIDAEQLPKLIRLGSFRGLAVFEVNGPLKIIGGYSSIFPR